jgi:hypothetical protein
MGNKYTQSIVGVLISNDMTEKMSANEKWTAFKNDPLLVGIKLSECFHDKDNPLNKQ